MTVITHHPKREFHITDVVGAAQTVLSDGLDDVTVVIQASYVVEEESGGGSSGGTVSLIPGTNGNIYADGVDTVQLQVAANGAVTVQRTAGADTFNVKLLVVYI